MKKIFLLCSLILCFFAGYSQTLTTTTTSITSGGTFNISGSGESNTASGKYFNAFQSQSVTSVTPSSALSSITLSSNGITYFNKTTNAPTVLIDKIVNSASVAVTVNFKVVIEAYNNGTLQEGAPQTFNFTIVVNPAPSSFPNVAKSAVFVKNSCGVGFIGSSVTYTVPAGQYHASTQAAADQLAQNDINANGQNYANSQGTCTAGYYNQAESAIYTRSNCTVGTIPTSVTYTVPAGTYTGATQSAANQLALNDIATNGQAYANLHGACNTIYARLVLGTNITQTTSGTQVISTKDLTLSFYSDAACTLPLTLTSPLTLSVNEKQVITHGTGTGGNFTLTYTAAAGTNNYDAGDTVIQILDTGAHSTTLYQYTLNNNGTYTPEP